MHLEQPADEFTAHRSSPILYGISIFVHSFLFLTAAAALTIFYLTYRPAYFSHTFIVVGLLLTAPWFLLSLLPMLFGLEDKELRREILVRQLLTMLAIVVFLIGLAVFVGYDQELWTQIVALTRECGEVAKYAWQTLSVYITTSIDTLALLFDDKVRPYFSG